MSKRDSPLLPVSESREAALFFVISALCFLATLAALTGYGTYKAASAWSAQIDGDLTIILRDADVAMAESVNSRIEALSNVETSRLLLAEEVETLLEPSLGAGGIPDGLPLPMIIAVQANAEIGEPALAIAALLEDMNVAGDVADNANYADTVGRSLALLRHVAIAIVVLLSSTAIAVIASATNAALLARREIVEVLHLSGATDRYIAGLFERRFWLLALKAGTAGAIAALMITALIVFSGGTAKGVEAQLLPKLSLGFWDLSILLACPIIAGLAARLAARTTVLSSLKDMV